MRGPGQTLARCARATRLIVALLLVIGGATLPAPAGAVAGDAVTINDAIDSSNPKGDIRQVGVGEGVPGSLVFTMKVEQYTNPVTDPAWVSGFTGALWAVDTSGDQKAEIVVRLVNRGGGGVAGEVVDATSDVMICQAAAAWSSVSKTYTVTVPRPGCLGDVKRPAVSGIFVFDTLTARPLTDEAPDGGGFVRFNRPPAGQATGGYAIAGRSAGFQRFGARPAGSVTLGGTFAGYTPPSPVVGTASARPYKPGLWSVTGRGQVLGVDGAALYGDALGIQLDQPIVGMAVLPGGSGYWLVARDGGIFSFGDAEFLGSTGGVALNKPIVGMAATPTGQGYWLVAADGGTFAYGDANFHGSTGGIALSRPVVGMAAGLIGQGYWLVASDGGIFAFGVPFLGSTGGTVLAQPIVGMAATRSGGGYRFLASDGGIFSFGDAEYQGSGAAPGRTDAIGIATA